MSARGEDRGLISAADRRRPLVRWSLGSGQVHRAETLVYLGVHLFDNCDLEALAQAAASRKRWEFLLTAAPLPIPGGTGSPLNPIATF